MFKNIIANFAGKFWGVLSGFFFIPLYIHYLGFESYSVISFTLVISSVMAILDVGLTATLSREFARADIEIYEKRLVFKNLEFLYLILMMVSIGSLFFSANFIIENWIHLKMYSPKEVAFFLKVISFDIGFQLLFRFYIGGLLGLEKQVRANMYQILWGILRNGCVVFVIIYEPTLKMFFLWQTISTIIFTIILKVVLERSLNGFYSFNFSPKIEKIVFKNMWRFAGGMFLIAFVAAINTQMDRIVISKMLSVESLGYYTLAISLSQSILQLVNPIATALLPRFTAQYSCNKNEEVSVLFNKVSLVVSILVFSIMANLMFFASDIIWIWTGNRELAQKSSLFIPVLAFAYAMLSLQVIPYYIAIANGYTKLNNILGLSSLFITLPGYWFGVQIYGSIGAAYVFCFIQTISTFIYFYFINKKFIKSKIVRAIYFKQILFPLSLTLGICFMFSLIPIFTGNDRILSLIWIGLSTILTFGVTILVLVDKSEVRRINIFVDKS